MSSILLLMSFLAQPMSMGQPIGDYRASSGGVEAFAGKITANGGLTLGSASPFIQTACTATIADNGAGSNATLTLTPACSNYEITCSDTQACDVTMGETGMTDGFLISITNVSAKIENFADTSGVSELPVGFGLDQYETLNLKYITDRWVAP